VFTVSTTVGDFDFYVMNGGGHKTFDSDIVIPAGTTITLKLKRASTERAINASGHKVFMYFQKSL
jgi:hypothetical protein